MSRNFNPVELLFLCPVFEYVWQDFFEISRLYVLVFAIVLDYPYMEPSILKPCNVFLPANGVSSQALQCPYPYHLYCIWNLHLLPGFDYVVDFQVFYRYASLSYRVQFSTSYCKPFNKFLRPQPDLDS